MAGPQVISVKPRIRVKANSTPSAAGAMAPPVVYGGGYLRDTNSRVISTRIAPLTESRDNIRRSWRTVAGLAQDLVLNSGRLTGAINQVIADTVGAELLLAPTPDPATMHRLGFDDQELVEFIRLIKAEWKYWAWSKREVDLRGKQTFHQMIDIGLRSHMIYGEIVGTIGYWTKAQRARHSLRTGVKVCMLPPSRLVQDTNEFEGLFQGVYHDVNGRAVQYLITERNAGFMEKKPYLAFDSAGRPTFVHVFEPVGEDDVRGISPLAAGFRKYIQHEMLEDATLQMAVLQTVLALTLTSEAPKSEVIEALSEFSAAGGDASQLAQQFIGMYAGKIEKAGDLSFGTDPGVSHLAPGETFEVHNVQAPGQQYQPFSASLSRDMARAIGVTYESLTLDNTGATYSSSRVGISSIWPVVIRRRERIAGPLADAIYSNWLDEMIFEGVIPFKGGYKAFEANRDRICWAQWRGPAKPSADDKKSAEASTERLGNFTSSVEFEAAELGQDAEELRERQYEEHQWFTSRGMRSPYAPKPIGGSKTEAPGDGTDATQQ